MAKMPDTTPQSMSPMPTIYALGCALAAVNAEHARIDDGRGKRDAALNLLTNQETALDNLIASLPAVTMADAAVQIGVACTLVNLLAACDWKDRQERLELLHANMERLLLSALPFVAEAADLDMTAMHWHEHFAFRAQRFGLEEAGA